MMLGTPKAESVINRIVAARPDHAGALTVACLGGTRTMPLAEFHDRARAVAGALRRKGIRAGERIGIRAGNCLEWALLDLAALMLGVQTAGFEPGKFTADADLIDRYGLDLLYCDGANAAGTLPITEISAYADEPPPELDPVVYGPTECTTVKFTSGPTGVPKGLAATVGSIDSSLAAVQLMFDHRRGDNLLAFLPLSLLQQRYWLYSALRSGHDITITNYQSVFAVLPTVRPTVVMGVPGFSEAAKRHIESRLGDGLDTAAAARTLSTPPTHTPRPATARASSSPAAWFAPAISADSSRTGFFTSSAESDRAGRGGRPRLRSGRHRGDRRSAGSGQRRRRARRAPRQGRRRR
ncbi:AMP-binding protein [Nocardia sp. NPDC051052]|uniref:AMP-binding protein n=1 Tax=Nocardia sp. NPDC051052 TaxID=3364322 RepID=UPI00379A243D